MARKEYCGKIKYLGANSNSQLFKQATVVLQEENNRCLLKTCLKCNPRQVYRSTEISKAEVLLRGSRLIVRHAVPHHRDFWELHFLGEPAQISQKLYQAITNLQKKVLSKSPHQNRAEVGVVRQMGIPSSTDKTVAGQVSQKVGKVPSQSGQIIFHTDRLDGGSEPPVLLTPPRVATSPSRFTSVKENRRHTGDAEMSSDDESKENQYSGPLSIEVDKQNKQGNRKPLQTSAFRFYGSSSSDTCFVQSAPKTYHRPSLSAPLVKPDWKKGLFTDITKTYSWKPVRTSTPATNKEQMAQQLQGFANIGNTCYMNAILQSLFSLDTFAADLYSLYKKHSKTLTTESLAVALTRLMLCRARFQSTSGTAKPLEDKLRNVKRAISSTARRFSGSQQHDAHEFLCQVLDQLKEEVVRATRTKEEKEPRVFNSSLTSASLTSSSASSSDSVHSRLSKMTAFSDNGLVSMGTSTDDFSTDHTALCTDKASPTGHKALPTDRASPVGKASPSDLKASPMGKASPTNARASPTNARASPSDPKVSFCDHQFSPTEDRALVAESSPQLSVSAVLINPTYANFEFEVIHTFQCTMCQEQVEKTELCNDLSLDLPSSRQSEIKLSLQDAVDIFFQEEEIEYICEKCGRTKAKLRHRFARLPRVLILHLKRYTYDVQSRKVLQELQLPRYITLHEYCDMYTSPHLPQQLPQISPMKSPLLTSPDSSQRRHKLTYRGQISECETTLKKSPKKVRRSLLPEVSGDDAVVPDTMAATVDLDDDFDARMKLATKLSLKEYNRRQMDHKYSRIQGSHENNNNSGMSTFSFTNYSEVDGDIDVLKLSEEEQLELVMKRSLQDMTPVSHVIPTAPDCPPPSLLNPQPVFKRPFSAPSDNTDFTLLCNNPKDGAEVIHAVEEQYRNGHATPEEIPEPREFDHGAAEMRNFTTASDFMRDADNRRSSPEGSSGVNNQTGNETMTDSSFLSSVLASVHRTPPRQTRDALLGYEHLAGASLTSIANGSSQCNSLPGSHSQFMTSCGQSSAQLQNALGETRVSTNIGSIGCMSSSQPSKEGAEQSNGTSMEVDLLYDPDSLPELTVSNEAEDAGGGEELSRTSPCVSPQRSTLTPQLSCMDASDCSHTPPPHAVNGSGGPETWTPAEEKMIAEEMEEEMPEALAMQVELSVDLASQLSTKNAICPSVPERKDGKRDTEEKENLSPVSGKGGQHPPAPVDKEMEARLIERKVRLSKIEKGMFSQSYRLVSIVNHLGETSGLGHYVNDVLDIKKQTWFIYNDEHVEKTTESYVRSKRTRTGYIFFYLSKDIFDDIDSMLPSGGAKEPYERARATV